MTLDKRRLLSTYTKSIAYDPGALHHVQIIHIATVNLHSHIEPDAQPAEDSAGIHYFSCHLKATACRRKESAGKRQAPSGPCSRPHPDPVAPPCTRKALEGQSAASHAAPLPRTPSPPAPPLHTQLKQVKHYSLAKISQPASDRNVHANSTFVSQQTAIKRMLLIAKQLEGGVEAP